MIAATASVNGNTPWVLTLVTLVLGFAFQAWQASRFRRWQKEDQVEMASVLAAKVTLEAARVAMAVEDESRKTAASAAAASAELITAINRNTEICVKVLYGQRRDDA